ncbi:MAG: hypothetical protein HDR12_15650 [Lachnospiraceae bacterium]|nr:hypothetical protein [Lachnospiraceae bacterium]
MDNKTWNYKNFNMVVELDIAGEFIYNGIKEFNRMHYITNDAPTFLSLYNISVGLERLQKIVLVLWKLDDNSDKEQFEKGLITHSHSYLRDEIRKCAKDSKYSLLNERENDFITLIQKFYNTARYDRFNINGKNNIETSIFEEYISKYIKVVSHPFYKDGIVLTDEIKEFLGRVVGSISHKYYQLVIEGSYRNHTFTYELRSDSKAQKVFLPEYKKKSLMEGQLNERISFKEILIYVRNTREKTAFLKFIDDIEPLEFDPALVIDYLGEFAEGTVSQSLLDEVEFLYGENEYSNERVELVDLIGNPQVMFEYPYIEACNDILFRILKDKAIDDDMINCLDKHIDYIDDDDILEVLNKVKRSYQEYKEGKCKLEVFLEQIQENYNEYQNFLIREGNRDEDK